MNREMVRRARKDVGVFARALVGEPLWDHQLEVLRSGARHRVLCSGRQAGKSRTLAMGALHRAFTKARRLCADRERGGGGGEGSVGVGDGVGVGVAAVGGFGGR